MVIIEESSKIEYNKNQALIGQLATAHICDWLTKDKQIYKLSSIIFMRWTEIDRWKTLTYLTEGAVRGEISVERKFESIFIPANYPPNQTWGMVNLSPDSGQSLRSIWSMICYKLHKQLLYLMSNVKIDVNSSLVNCCDIHKMFRY